MAERIGATRARGLGSLEVIYAKGQEWDWYNDPF
jgi:hypothetical protein